jgi:glycosyltransferase involved in cell wall biosynthesis
MATDPTPAEILEEARVLLHQGEQGRVVALLDGKFSTTGLNPEAADLRGLALAQLVAAGRSSGCGPVDANDRADVLAVRSILKQGASAPIRPVKGRIALVMHSLGPGGIQRQMVRLVEQQCNAPDPRIESICILLLGRSKTAPTFHWDALTDLKVTIEPYPDEPADLGDVVDRETAEKLGVLPAAQSRRVAHLVGQLHRYRPEIILAMGETNGLISVLAGSIVGIPRIVISGRGEPPPARSLYDELLKPAYQIALAQNKLSLVTNSAATARHFGDWLGLPHERVGVIYNGIDVDEMLAGRDPGATAAYRRSLGIPEGAPIVGSIFNARREKRPQLWIAAAAAIAKRAPDVHFVLVGGGRWMSDVPHLLARYGLQGRVHTPGVRKDVAAWFELMDVFLLTSENEGTPNVLLEAQSLGRPVVATDVGGNAETFIPGETGILLPADPTPEEIADAVLSIVNDPALSRRARTNAPAFIRQRFGTKRMVAEFVELCLGADGDPVTSSARLRT